MKRAIAWFVENHVATNLVMAFMLLAGIVTAFTMKVEVFPSFALDKVLITVEYEGASPEEIERAVIKPIEEQIAGVEGIKRIDSTAREGVGSIVVEVEQGWDSSKVYDDVRMEVDRVRTLPEEAERPRVQLVTHRSQVIWVAVSGNIGERALKRLGEKIKDDITSIPGITSAELFGTRPSEIHIAIPQENLRRYGLSLPQVAKAIRAWGLEIPGGKIHTRGGEILIRAMGRRYYAKKYADIPVKAFPDGRILTLGQIADLREGFADVDIMARYQGMPAVLIQVYRVADQNALTVANKVKEYVARIRPSLPRGVEIGVYADQSKILKSRLELLIRNMLMGLVLVVVLLGLFLELRLAFWVTLGIPLSFLTAIWMLPHFDVSINMISLFGFILVLGIVVDDAIVIGEHIQSYRERGMEPAKASIEATTRMATPVIFSVLTTVAAFAPLLMATGTMGKVMRNLPIVVILVLMASLFEALMLLPSHLSRMKLKRRRKEKRAVAALNRFIHGPYKRALAFCLRWRYATIAAGVGLVLLSVGTFTGGWLKFRLFPTVESDVMVASVEMPPGTPIEQTLKVVARLEKAVRKAMAKAHKLYQPPDSPPLIKNIVSLVGVMATRRHAVIVGPPATGGHLGQIYVELLGGEHRQVSTTTLVNMWRKEVGTIPGVQRLSFSGEIFSPGYPIEVHLSAPSEQELRTAADELKRYLGHLQGVFDINDSFTPGKWEVRFTLKPKAAALGLTLADVAAQVRGAFLGSEALRFQRGKDEVKVRTILPAEARAYRESLSQLMISLPGGGQVPFEEIAQVKMRRGYTIIERSQRRRVIKVTADIDPKAANANEIRHKLATKFLPTLASHYPELRWSLEGEAKEQRESLRDVFLGFVIALFLIYALLAIPFKTYTQPFLVMTAIPFGIVGAVAGHLLMGLELSLLSLFGIVGLAGVVVNDSLVLIDAANRLRREKGMSPWEAIMNAGPLRFRPIMLTSVTTFAGLMPMITERSVQAQFLIPMAVSLGFGVLFATAITLLLIPCGYLALEDFFNVLKRLKQKILPSQTE